MKQYIGYIRVSTVKQGVQGVSLIEQKSAITRYSDCNQLPIGCWLEEMETAAKRGRPVFTQALKLLGQGKFQGIILHKLDRGARNLRDWAAIGELSDQGVEVHFVNESLDLQSRGGRLSADIQAVVAADYIRNLREETRKGFYGRLKQGLYPLRAPVGYLDRGKGKAKTIDPIMGPLVRHAFELYGTARFSLETLGDELHRLGLRNRHRGRVTRNGLSTLLNNPFYIGLIRIQKTGENFNGIHEPLFRKAVFDRVQNVLAGKVNMRNQHHRFLFRRMLSCSTCGYSLIGERQKGNVYYRCHTKKCPPTSVREAAIESQVSEFFRQFSFDDRERAYFKTKVAELRENWTTRQEEETQSLKLRLAQIKDRLNRVTDAYLDQALDKMIFEERKKGLLLDQTTVEDNLANLTRTNSSHPDKLDKFLELAGNASLGHQMAIPEEKREMVEIFTSNRIVSGKKLDLKPSISFQEIANRSKNDHCDPYRDGPRMWDNILDRLNTLNMQGQLPDLSVLAAFREHKDTVELKE